MNSIQEINRINEQELRLGVKGSWHDEFRDSAYIFVGGLHLDLTEGDVITIFSQWGEIADINLPRDKESGKVRGFGFVMYEDQRSTVLAVDNMNGTEVLGRTLRVDHARYTQPGKRNEEGEYEKPEEASYNARPPELDESSSESEDEKPAEEDDGLDSDDPMTALIRAERAKKAGKEERRAAKAARKEARAKKRAEREERKRGEKGGRERSERARSERGRSEREHSERGGSVRSRSERDRSERDDRARVERRREDKGKNRDDGSEDRRRERTRSRSPRPLPRDDYRGSSRLSAREGRDHERDRYSRDRYDRDRDRDHDNRRRDDGRRDDREDRRRDRDRRDELDDRDRRGRGDDYRRR